MITREQFMEFFRSEDFHDKITVSDAHEIFVSVLHGSSDLEDGKLIKQLESDYCVDLGKEFPSGFTAWQETHFEMVQAITIDYMQEEPYGVVYDRHDEQGIGGLYELAEELTNEFELKYKDVNWGDGIDFYDTIEDFIEEKL